MKRSKGQTAIEFLVLLGFMLFVFTSFFTVLRERTSLVQQRAQYNEVLLVADIVLQEVRNADRVSDGYNRTFELPGTVNAQTYTVTLTSNTEVTITTPETEYLVFLPTNISLDYPSGPASSGPVSIGTHTITKTNGRILLSP